MFAAPYAVPADAGDADAMPLLALAPPVAAHVAPPEPVDIATDGQPIYAAIVKPTLDGRLVVTVPVDANCDDWVIAELSDAGDIARIVAALAPPARTGNA